MYNNMKLYNIFDCAVAAAVVYYYFIVAVVTKWCGDVARGDNDDDATEEIIIIIIIIVGRVGLGGRRRVKREYIVSKTFSYTHVE